jgi:predicted MFS family arabinose efflux permease
MSAAGAAVFLLLPVIVGSAVDDLGFSERQSGYLISSYFAGYMLVGISALFWIRRVNWRVLALTSYVVLALGLSIAAFLHNLAELAVIFFVTGSAAGALFGLGVTMISDSANPDRNFGLVLVSQQLLAAWLLFTLPDLVIARWGFKGLSLALAVFLLILAYSVVWIVPSKRQETEDNFSQPVTAPLLPSWVWTALAALAIYFAALSAVWAFVERLANTHGLTTAQIGFALGISMIGGVVGGLGAVVFGDRWGRVIPLTGSTLLFIAVFFFYGQGFQVIGFTLATFLFVAAWNYILAYQMAIITELDQAGRYSVLIPPAQALGALCGPLTAGYIIQGFGYISLLWCASIVITFSIIPFTIFTRAAKCNDQKVA